MTVKCLHVILWGKNSSAMVCEENFIKLSDQAPVVECSVDDDSDCYFLSR